MKKFGPIVAVVAIFLLASGNCRAAKTDVVKLENGDRVTGEIQSLEYGSMTYKTDSMGTVNIDWEEVLSLKSNQSLQVERVDGTRHFGKIEETGTDGAIRVVWPSGSVELQVLDVVRITPIEADKGFLERLEGSFSLGFQAQKSSEVATSNVAADISYRTRRFLVGLRLNSTVTSQPSEDTSANQSLDLNYQAFRPDRWFSDWFVGWERNDELGIQARTSAGAAWGRYLIQTNNNNFSVTAGAQASRETYTGSDPSDIVYEGRVEVRYLHRRLEPSTSLNFTTQYYPRLGDLSHYRANSALNLNWEFIDDMYLGLSLTYSYTSDPPTDASKSDYAVTTSLGYSF